MINPQSQDEPDSLTVRNVRFKALMERIAASPDPGSVTMSIEDAAAYIPMTKGQLAQLRYKGCGPKFLKPSPRTVIYRKRDVDAWLNSSVRTTTADEETWGPDQAAHGRTGHGAVLA